MSVNVYETNPPMTNDEKQGHVKAQAILTKLYQVIKKKVRNRDDLMEVTAVMPTLLAWMLTNGAAIHPKTKSQQLPRTTSTTASRISFIVNKRSLTISRRSRSTTDNDRRFHYSIQNRRPCSDRRSVARWTWVQWHEAASRLALYHAPHAEVHRDWLSPSSGDSAGPGGTVRFHLSSRPLVGRVATSSRFPMGLSHAEQDA